MNNTHKNVQFGLNYTSDFFAKIYLVLGDSDFLEFPLRLSEKSDKPTLGFTPQDNWLEVCHWGSSPLFKFAYHSQTKNRLHYHISGTGNNAKKKLGASRNGYLGLYEVSEVTDYWKLEPLKWTHRGLVCRWRDHRGHQVKRIGGTGHRRQGYSAYLNVEEGEIGEFLIEPSKKIVSD